MGLFEQADRGKGVFRHNIEDLATTAMGVSLGPRLDKVERAWEVTPDGLVPIDWMAELEGEPLRKAKVPVRAHLRGGRPVMAHQRMVMRRTGAAPVPEDVADAIESAMEFDGFTVLDAALQDHDELREAVATARTGRTAVAAAWRARGGNTDPLPPGFTERGGMYIRLPEDTGPLVYRATTADETTLDASGSAFAAYDLMGARYYWPWVRSRGVIAAYPRPSTTTVDDLDDLAELIASDDKPASWWSERWADEDFPDDLANIGAHDPELLPALRAAGVEVVEFDEASGTTIQLVSPSPVPGKVIGKPVPGQQLDEDIAFETLEELWG
jgi:hypothetical protein